MFGAEEVREITSLEQLEQRISSPKPVVVFFYAPWCPHCQATKPLYDKVAAKVKGLEFVQINADAMTEVQLAFALDGYPTIVFFDGSANARATKKEYEWPGDDPDEVTLMQFSEKHLLAASSMALNSNSSSTAH
jgi:thiol-disulfide isomerase/thioredoxin